MINKVGRFFLAKGVKFVWLFQYTLNKFMAHVGKMWGKIKQEERLSN